jgi:hypothetical protein
MMPGDRCLHARSLSDYRSLFRSTSIGYLLNNAKSRDTSAMNAKLGAIIWAIEAADNRMIGLERRSEAAAPAVNVTRRRRGA